MQILIFLQRLQTSSWEQCRVQCRIATFLSCNSFHKFVNSLTCSNDIDFLMFVCKWYRNLFFFLLIRMMRYVQQIHCSVFFGSLLLAEQHTNLFIAQWWVLWRPFRDLGQYLGTNNPKLLFSWWGENTNVLCLDTVHQPVGLLRWPWAQCLFIEMRCGSCELCLRPVNNREVCGSHVQTKTWL